MTKKKSLMSWSGGKDCTMALHQHLESTGALPDGLLTVYGLGHGRVTMHGVRMELIERQAKELGIPLFTLGLPEDVTDKIYEEKLLARLKALRAEGFTEVVFGDIFLEDLRAYRIAQLEQVGMSYSFPIWQRETSELIGEFITKGFKARVVSVNGTVLQSNQAGAAIDAAFVRDLPENVDPCGENGEFHTFVYDGPLFKNPVPFNIGETVKRTYSLPENGDDIVYWFTDLLPGSSAAS